MSPFGTTLAAYVAECEAREPGFATRVGALMRDATWYNFPNGIRETGARLEPAPGVDHHLARRCGLATIRIPLSDGNFVTIDADDYSLVSQFAWRPLHCKNMTYAVAWPRGQRKTRKVVLLHRLLLNAQPGEEVDHRDGDGLNCTRQNMRLATRGQNCRNQRRSTLNTSGYKGVHWDKARQRWSASIKHDGRSIHLGRFTDKEAAARAYDAKARELGGEFARLNFPGEGELAA
jgi:hypothetical protein